MIEYCVGGGVLPKVEGNLIETLIRPVIAADRVAIVGSCVTGEKRQAEKQSTG
jgi:hypothetical protein